MGRRSLGGVLALTLSALKASAAPRNDHCFLDKVNETVLTTRDLLDWPLDPLRPWWTRVVDARIMVDDFGDVTQELLEASYPRLLARCGAFDYRKLTKAYWFWEMRRDDHARAGPPPDGEDLPPAVRVAFGRGPGRRRFSGRGAEAGLAKLPPFLVDRLPAPARPLD